MTSFDLAIMGLKNLFRRKARTILTVLGVVIGTAAIVVMVSLGIGMNRAFESQLEQYGSLTMINIHSYGGMIWNEDGSTQEVEQKVLDDEAIAFFESIQNVEYALGFKRVDGRIFAGKYHNYASIQAVDLDKFSKMDVKLSQGRMPEKTGDNEVLFGFSAAKDFYDPNSRNPWGGERPSVDIFEDRIELIPSNQHFERQPRGFKINPTGITTEDNWDYSWSMYIDFDVYEKLKRDFDRRNRVDNNQNEQSNNRRDRNKKENKFDEIKVSVDHINNVQDVQQIIRDQGYQAYSLNDALDQMKETSAMIQGILGGIGGVSLFIAAIGITNTMVMSIYERTKEIGVMKVIGAQLKDIKRLFLFEAATIGLLGGFIGIGLSYAVSYLINSAISGMNNGMGYGPQISSYIPPWLALSALGFSTIIGLVAGYYPAVRATKLSALEAIRTE